MDFTTALSVSWPVLLVCVVAVAAAAWAMKKSNDALRQSFDQIAGNQTQLGSKIDAVDQQMGDFGKRQSELASRLASCEQKIQRQAEAPAAVAAKAAAPEVETIEVSDESLQRFEAASQALAQLAQELGGFDTRQTENWQRIRGDLEEQGFHLQRVQQHVDGLFNGSAPHEVRPRLTENAA